MTSRHLFEVFLQIVTTALSRLPRAERERLTEGYRPRPHDGPIVPPRNGSAVRPPPSHYD